MSVGRDDRVSPGTGVVPPAERSDNGPRLRLRLLGDFSAEAESAPAELHVSSRKARALLAYLAMQPGLQATRTVLSDLLWGDRPDAQARQSLRQCLVLLRRDLAPLGEEILQFDGDAIRLDAARVTADALDFAVLAASGDPADMARAAELHAREFLAGFVVDVEPFDEWARRERERLAGLAARVLANTAQQADAAGAGERAIALAERLVALDPLREQSHRLLLTMLARHRGRDAALARARDIEALMRRELDVGLEVATAELVAMIRNGALTPPPSGGVRPPAGPVAPAATPAITPPTSERSRRWRPGLRAAAVGLAALIVVLALARVIPLPGALFGSTAVVLPNGTEAAGNGASSWRSPQIYPGNAIDTEKLAERGAYAIVVLPFRSDAGDGTLERRLADRMSNDLINELSRIPTLRVIARQTSQLYRGLQVDVAAIGAELGVRYVIDGSLRLDGPSMRIDVSAVEAATRLHVYTERFERERSERHGVVDEITRGLARRLQLGITEAAGRRAERGAVADAPTEALLARGWSIIFRSQHTASVEGAERLFAEALLRHPEHNSALVGLAAVKAIEISHFKVANREGALAEAQALLERVLARKGDVASAHYFMGLICRLRGELPEALTHFQAALSLNPSLSSAYAQVGHVLARMGRQREGLEHIRYAMRLSPKDPSLGLWKTFAGLAHLNLGENGAALAQLSEAVALAPRMPLAHAALASALALGGDFPAAQRQVLEFKRLVPGMTAESMRDWFGRNRDESDGKLFLKGLHMALEGSA